MAYTTIDNGEEHFSAVTYTGTGSSRSITGLEFGPDWVWIKRRNGAYSHYLYDSTRGTGKQLYAEKTDAEATDNTEVTAFNSDGFSLGSGSGTNENTNTQVAWCWKANGGTTSSNSNGSITSTVQANTTAGFSIVTYVSNNTEGATFGHGLSLAPDLVIVKGRDSADNWAVFNGTSTTNSRSLHLDTTDGEIPVSSYNFWNLYWDETRPSSTVVTLGVDAKVNKSGNENFVAYCFHSVQGYSKIGKYIGNGNADGPFIYTGFKPALVIAKRTDGNGNDWRIADNKRDPFNIVDGRIKINSSDAEDSSDQFDFLSNGFKVRTTAGDLNGTSGHAFFYIAFAEHPFVSSKGVPVTAR